MKPVLPSKTTSGGTNPIRRRVVSTRAIVLAKRLGLSLGGCVFCFFLARGCGSSQTSAPAPIASPARQSILPQGLEGTRVKQPVKDDRQSANQHLRDSYRVPAALGRHTVVIVTSSLENDSYVAEVAPANYSGVRSEIDRKVARQQGTDSSNVWVYIVPPVAETEITADSVIFGSTDENLPMWAIDHSTKNVFAHGLTEREKNDLWLKMVFGIVGPDGKTAGSEIMPPLKAFDMVRTISVDHARSLGAPVGTAQFDYDGEHGPIRWSDPESKRLYGRRSQTDLPIAGGR